MIVRYILVMTLIKGDGRESEWDSMDTALDVPGLWPIREYVSRWQGKPRSM